MQNLDERLAALDASAGTGRASPERAPMRAT
jgi:hypothetical protein